MNLKRLVSKLQTALCERGQHYKVNHVQVYSPKTNRMITKYVVIHSQKVDDRIKNTTILETYKLYEVVQTLANIYKGDTL